MTSGKAVITAAEPQLFVADIKSSCDFFTSKLGFAVVFTYGEPPFYAQVVRDGARLNLRHVDRPVIDARCVTARNCCPPRSRSRAPTKSRRCFPSFRPPA